METLNDFKINNQVKNSRDKGKGIKKATFYDYKRARIGRTTYSCCFELVKTLVNRGVPYQIACELAKR